MAKTISRDQVPRCAVNQYGPVLISKEETLYSVLNHSHHHHQMFFLTCVPVTEVLQSKGTSNYVLGQPFLPLARCKTTADSWFFDPLGLSSQRTGMIASDCSDVSYVEIYGWRNMDSYHTI